MKASFEIVGNSGESHRIVVDCKWWGGEYYYVDDRLAHKRFNLGLSGTRSLSVDGVQIDIVARITIRSFDCHVNVNGSEYISELFPEYSEKIRKMQERRAQRNSKHDMVKNFVLWVVIAIVLLSIFHKWEQKKKCDQAYSSVTIVDNGQCN